MWRLILLGVLFVLIARTFWRFFDAVVTAAGGTRQPGARPGNMQTGVKMAPCPVCGTYVVPGKAITQGSGSGIVYFCSDKCRADYVPR
jgi:hypothetical protein